MSESSKESNDIRCLPIQAEAWVIWPHSTCGARRASCGAKAHPGPVRDRAVNGRGGYGHARTGRPLRREARKKALVGALVGVGVCRYSGVHGVLSLRNCEVTASRAWRQGPFALAARRRPLPFARRANLRPFGKDLYSRAFRSSGRPFRPAALLAKPG